MSKMLAVVLPWLACMQPLSLSSETYDPSVLDRAALDPAKAPAPLELSFVDAKRERNLPIKVWLPAGAGARPVLLFSHGLGGARTNNAYLGQHWSGRGYVAVFLQHPGSDEEVWRSEPLATRMEKLTAAANRENLLARAGDVSAVLDQLGAWNEEPKHALQGRLDLSRVGMSGHSFGAVTTQAVSGQKQALGKSLLDSRIKAAVAMSPSVPLAGDAGKLFGDVRLPWMLLTGTEDASIVGRADPESRLEVYPALPPGGKYELVLEGAEHSAFGDRALPGDKRARNPQHHRAILALTTAFWDAYLLDSKPAREWLDGAGPRGVLEPKDRWQHK